MMTGKDYDQQSSLGQPHHCSGTFADDSCPELRKAVYYREKKRKKEEISEGQRAKLSQKAFDITNTVDRVAVDMLKALAVLSGTVV